MPTRPPLILHVVLPVPVRHHFDYLAEKDIPFDKFQPGVRVNVPFGKGHQRIGIVIGTSNSSEVHPKKLKPISNVIDNEPLFDSTHFKLLQWASNYYHYPLGELIFSTLPGALRKAKKVHIKTESLWNITDGGRKIDNQNLARAKKQLAILNFIKAKGSPVSDDILNKQFKGWRAPMESLVKKGLMQKDTIETDTIAGINNETDITFNFEQSRSINIIEDGLSSGSRFLLDGITGSGKTEVYLEIIKKVLHKGKQALVLVPEIGLTPHFISRIKARLRSNLVVLHSGLSDSERLRAWLKARAGHAQVVLGTRSAIWTPLKNPGIFIVDEEHDQSYKQQESFRYSARDIAILRASYANAPIILGSATPSLESLHNVEINKLNRVTISERVGSAVPPKFRIVDMRGEHITGALSNTLITSIADVVKQKKQVLLFQNRRGYSPVIMCHGCGWIHNCKRCDIPMTYHKSRNMLICHHCASQCIKSSICSICNSKDLLQIGHGTERLNETLKEYFPEARILRIDRDSTRRKGAMQDYMEKINSGAVDVLIGTQMLAKGHHFPNVTLVGIIDADRGLFSTDFRASERMAQIIVQVSGRAGRANDPGVVMIQTHYPEHPFLMTLVQKGYNTFADMLQVERKTANLPPYSFQTMLRAEAFEEKLPLDFLNSAASLIKESSKRIEIFGPFPAPIEKRAGRFRFQLLLQSTRRMALQKAILPWIEKLEQIKNSKKIRWSVDVDPQEIL